MSPGRINDLDLLGPPRSCRRLPARTVLAAVLGLLVLASLAILGKVLA